MAYDKQKIFEQAKEMIVKHKLFFIDDIVAFLLTLTDDRTAPASLPTIRN